MARIGEPIHQYKTAKGLQAYELTPRDMEIVKEISRWNVLTANDVVTRVLPPSKWYPPMVPELNPHGDGAFITDGVHHDDPTLVEQKASRTVRHRLTRLTNNYPWPYLRAATDGRRNMFWQATATGNQAVGIDHAPNRTGGGFADVSPKLNHMISAARVGRCLELGGYRVLSEKEIISEVALDGHEVPLNLSSEWCETPNSPVILKRPDLVMTTADNQNYVAIEVELSKYRPRATYESKLAAYAANPTCIGIIYVTTSKGILDRVSAAAKKVWPHLAKPPVVYLQLKPGTATAINYNVTKDPARTMFERCASPKGVAV